MQETIVSFIKSLSHQLSWLFIVMLLFINSASHAVLPLPCSCININDPVTGSRSDVLSEAAKKTLNDILEKNQHIIIKSCDAIWFNSSLDFDNQVSNGDIPYKALLFFDKGINHQHVYSDSSSMEQDKVSSVVNNINASKSLTSDRSIEKSQQSSRRYFTARSTVELQRGARIIGIPLNDDYTLAEGKFVGIDHYLEGSYLGRQHTFNIKDRDVLIAGFTTMPIAYNDKGYVLGNSAWHGEYINVDIREVNPSSSAALTLYNNQFIVMSMSPVLVNHMSDDLYSGYLYSFNDNQFVSCFSKKSAPYWAIALTYEHLSKHNISKMLPIKTIEIVNNHFYGEYSVSMMSLLLPGSTEALIQGNEYHESRENYEARITDGNIYTISALRIHEYDYAPTDNIMASIYIINNSFVHPGYSITTEGRLKLLLIDNELMGDKGAMLIDDHNSLSDNKLMISMNSSGNSYDVTLGNNPCEGLKGWQVHGNFTFVNGVMCPPSH